MPICLNVQDNMLRFGDEAMNKGIHCIRPSVLEKRMMVQFSIDYHQVYGIKCCFPLLQNYHVAIYSK